MKYFTKTITLLSIVLLTACSSGGSGLDVGPCGNLIQEMIDTVGNPDGPPEQLSLNGNKSLWYEYTRFDMVVAFFWGPDFVGCEFDFQET